MPKHALPTLLSAWTRSIVHARVPGLASRSQLRPQSFAAERIRAAARIALIALIALLQLLLGTAATAQVVSPKVKMPGFSREISLDTLVYSRVTVNAAPDVAFEALRGVYTKLKIPREITDSSQGLISAIRFRTSGSLGGQRFSTYLRCGVGLEGDNADTWQLSVAIASFLTPTGDGRTKIGTGFVAGARSNGGAAKEPVLCASTGELEALIARMLTEQLAARAR